MTSKAELYRLQQLDTAWDKIRQRIEQLQKFSGGSPALMKLRAQTQAIETELQAARSEQRNTEMETISLGERIREVETLLMSGSVRNPKELEALQANMESMQRHKSTLEDRSVEALVRVDELGKQYAEQAETLESQESEWQAKQEAIDEELKRRKKEFVYLKNIREEMVKNIDSKMLEQYEYLRRRKNGIAVAKLDEGTCTACHMQVPSGVVSNVQRDEALVSCTACGRILVAG